MQDGDSSGFENGRDEGSIYPGRGHAIADDLVEEEVIKLAQDEQHSSENVEPDGADLVQDSQNNVQHDTEI